MKLMKKILLAFMLGTVIILGAGCGNLNNQSAQSAEWNEKKASADDYETYKNLVESIQLFLAYEDAYEDIKELIIVVEIGTDGVVVDGSKGFADNLEEFLGSSLDQICVNNEAPSDNGKYRIVIDNGTIIQEIQPEQ